MPSTVAIIMRAKDEMPHIRRTIGMLQRQTFQDFDFFAIDSGSTDGTLDELRRFCPDRRLTRVAPEDYVPGRVLNDAIDRTEHEIVVLLNADAVPMTDQWLESLVEPLLNDEADATYSRQVARPDALFIVAYDYHRAYSSDTPSDHFFSAAACAFKRNLWERFKFHEEGYAEDAVWATACRMFNARFKLVPESAVEHSHNYPLEGLYQKRFRHGFSFARFHGEVSPLQHRLYLCLREIVRDLFHACGKREFKTIPYNVAYRVTIHAGLHRGIREGYK